MALPVRDNWDSQVQRAAVDTLDKADRENRAAGGKPEALLHKGAHSLSGYLAYTLPHILSRVADDVSTHHRTDGGATLHPRYNGDMLAKRLRWISGLGVSRSILSMLCERQW